MFVMTPPGIRMSPFSSVPKVMIDVTVSVVRFSERISTLFEAMSAASMFRNSFVSSTEAVNFSSVMAAAMPFSTVSVSAAVGL